MEANFVPFLSWLPDFWVGYPQWVTIAFSSSYKKCRQLLIRKREKKKTKNKLERRNKRRDLTKQERRHRENDTHTQGKAMKWIERRRKTVASVVCPAEFRHWIAFLTSITSPFTKLLPTHSPARLIDPIQYSPRKYIRKALGEKANEEEKRLWWGPHPTKKYISWCPVFKDPNLLIGNTFFNRFFSPSSSSFFFSYENKWKYTIINTQELRLYVQQYTLPSPSDFFRRSSQWQKIQNWRQIFVYIILIRARYTPDFLLGILSLAGFFLGLK